jgi:hypothetical protein
MSFQLALLERQKGWEGTDSGRPPLRESEQGSTPNQCLTYIFCPSVCADGQGEEALDWLKHRIHVDDKATLRPPAAQPKEAELELRPVSSIRDLLDAETMLLHATAGRAAH